MNGDCEVRWKLLGGDASGAKMAVRLEAVKLMRQVEMEGGDGSEAATS